MNPLQSILDTETETSAPGSNILFGRFMLPDMTEHPCQVIDIGADGAVFKSATVPAEGSAIVAYLEELGRVEVTSGPAVPDGFAVSYSMKGPRLERLQQRIDWLKQKSQGGAPENRRHIRYEPAEKNSQIAMPDGRVYQCEVMDISVSGAAIKTEVMPSVGTYIMLGKMRGRVVRYLDVGVGIEFVKQLDRTQMPSTAVPTAL